MPLMPCTQPCDCVWCSEEPAPTEEDLKRMKEMEARMDAEREAAIKEGEALPPAPEGLWKTRDEP